MPTFELTTTTEVDFSVYCANCGAGICAETAVDSTRMTINVHCPYCDSKHGEEIKSLEEEIEELKDELNQIKGK